MKTDPQNSDYIVESGASRNYEPWRAEDEVRTSDCIFLRIVSDTFVVF